MNTGDWFYGDVAYVNQKGLFLGTGDHMFSPGRPITREMAVTVLGRMADVDPAAYKKSAFEDVAENQYSMPYVAWAAEQGIVEGIGNNLFAPGKDITREDLCLMLYRYARAMDIRLPEITVPGSFGDGESIRPYARDAVAALAGAGVIQGKPGNLFDPKGTATRAETAAILRRISEII